MNAMGDTATMTELLPHCNHPFSGESNALIFPLFSLRWKIDRWNTPRGRKYRNGKNTLSSDALGWTSIKIPKLLMCSFSPQFISSQDPKWRTQVSSVYIFGGLGDSWQLPSSWVYSNLHKCWVLQPHDQYGTGRYESRAWVAGRAALR